MKPKTITIKKVRDAYKRTGVELLRCEMSNQEACSACAFGALYLDAHPQALASFKKKRDTFRGKRFDDLIFNWAERKYGVDFSQGFMDGFDSPNGKIYGNLKLYTQGFYEGQDVHNALGS